MPQKQIFFGLLESYEQSDLYSKFDCCERQDCRCGSSHFPKDNFMRLEILFAYEYHRDVCYYNMLIIYRDQGKLYKIDDRGHCYCCAEQRDFWREEIEAEDLKDILPLQDSYNRKKNHQPEILEALQKVIKSLGAS